MNKTIFALFFASILLFSALASAYAVFPFAVSGNSSTINPGASTTVQFAVNNTLINNITNLTFTLPTLNNIGVWSEAKFGSTPLTITNNQVSLGSSVVVAPKSLSEQLSFKFTANQGITPGLRSDTIRFTLNNLETGIAHQTDPLPIQVTISSTSGLTLSKIRELTRAQSGLINVTNTGNTALSNINLNASSTLANINFNKNNFNLASGASETVEVTAENLADLKFGTYTTTVTATSGSVSNALSFNSISQAFCKNGSVGSNLILKNIDISTNGEDEEEWDLLDVLKIEVEVENTGSNDIDDVEVVMGLFDSSGKNVVGDLEFENDEEESIDLGDVGDDDSETATFEFKVPADFDDGNYKLTFKAYSKDSGEQYLCRDHSDELDSSTYQSISVNREDDEGQFMAFDNIEFNPSEATCGDSVSLTFDLSNIGDDTEEQIKVLLENKELNLALDTVLTQDMDPGDQKKITMSFLIPNNAQDKTYSLALSAEYDYRNGVYREQSDESTKVPLKVFGCAVSPNPTKNPISITGASLESDAVAGKDMTVLATIKNSDTQDNSFTVSATGYQSWAKLSEISDDSFTLKAGESKDVTLTFNVNKDAKDEQSFVLNVRSNGLTKTQEVVATIEPVKTTGLSDIFSGNSALIWIVGIINVILIILIIVVAVKVSRR